MMFINSSQKTGVLQKLNSIIEYLKASNLIKKIVSSFKFSNIFIE